MQLFRGGRVGLEFPKRSSIRNEITREFKDKIVFENTLWSMILLAVVAFSQVVLILLEALSVLPWDNETFFFRLTVTAVGTLFSVLLASVRKNKSLRPYLTFIMILLNIIALISGVFFVIYFASSGNFSFTVFLLVVYLLSLGHFMRPGYFSIIYIVVFAATIVIIYSKLDPSIIHIGELITSGVFLMVITIGSMMSYSRYFRLFNQEKQLEAINKKLELISETDELTGLFNRRRISDEMEKLIAISERYNSIFSIAMIDIDHFKKINDTYGHNTGDEILRELAGLIKSKLRTSDLVGRWGGEEFILILPNTTPEDSGILLSRLQKDISNHSFCNGIKIAFSAGICGFLSGTSLNQLIDCADRALYNAKENGRNRTEIFSV